MSLRYIFCLVALLGLAGCSTSDEQILHFHTPPSEWDEPRIYHSPFQETYRDRIVIDRVSRERYPLDHIEKKYSLNEAYWFALDKADTSKSGPWNSSIYVFNEREDLIRMTLKDHSNSYPQVKWINEKLLYVECWLGRVLGFELIYDVESESIIHKEMVHGGTNAYRQWQEAKERGLIKEEPNE